MRSPTRGRPAHRRHRAHRGPGRRRRAPSPFPHHAHVVTTTTHKTLQGRAGLILTDDEDSPKKINKAVFRVGRTAHARHRLQGRRLRRGASPSSRPTPGISSTTPAPARRSSSGTTASPAAAPTTTLMLVDLRTKNADLTGQDAETWMGSPESSATRTESPTTRARPVHQRRASAPPPSPPAACTTEHMPAIAAWIDRVLSAKGDAPTCAAVQGEVRAAVREVPAPH